MTFISFCEAKFQQPFYTVRLSLTSLTIYWIAQLQIRRAARLMFGVHLFSNNRSCPIRRNGCRRSLYLQSWLSTRTLQR
jgi:hypothetical protein